MPNSEIKELIQAKQLLKEGKINEAKKILLELEKKSDLSPQELLSYKLFKANLSYKEGNQLEAFEIAEEVYQESQKQRNLILSLDALLIQAYTSTMRGKISQGEELIKNAEDLFINVKKSNTIDLCEKESFLTRIKANIHYFKGEIQPSLELNKKAYELVKDTSNKELIALSLNNIADKYMRMKEYDKAIIYAKKSIDVDYQPSLLIILATLVQIYIKKGNVKDAKVYLEIMREKVKENVTSFNRMHYRFTKASILKLSLRARDRIKSEDLFKELIMNEIAPIEQRLEAILNLCELYLIELRIINDPEIIDEIKPYIQKLLDITEQQHLYLYLTQTYVLNAKFYLLTFNIKKAKRFLTQAQRISERFGHKELAEKIASEQTKLLKQSEVWNRLKEMGAPMDERIKLAHINEHIEEIFERRGMIPAFITEEKVAISKETKICLVCRGEVSRFTYICKCGAIYCDNCARALTNLENVCWVCEKPIDYSKPVKSYREELEGINVDNKSKMK